MTVHEACLKLFAEFIRICNVFGFKWFADSGTLLGAIRKGEMIEWDDDIDVIMPRKDYNSLLIIGSKVFQSPFFFQTPMTDTMFEIHAKLRLDGTTSITEREAHGVHHKGICLDIFPLDAVPDNNDELQAEIGFLRLIGRYSSLHDIYEEKLVTPLTINPGSSFLMMNKFILDCTERNANSKYVGNVVFYRYSDYQYAKFIRKAYSDFELKSFKGLDEKIRIPVGYEEILKTWYGENWMIEKQLPAAHTSIVDANKDYRLFTFNER